MTTSRADCGPTYPTIPHMRRSLRSAQRRKRPPPARNRKFPLSYEPVVRAVVRQRAAHVRQRAANVTDPTRRSVQTPLTMECDLSGLLDAPERPPAQAGGDSLRRPHPSRVERAAREDAAAAHRGGGREAARP